MYESTQEEVTKTEKVASAFASVGKFIVSLLETVVVALVISMSFIIHMTLLRSLKIDAPTYKNGEYLRLTRYHKDRRARERRCVFFRYSDTQILLKGS
jgi:hypothetical protein